MDETSQGNIKRTATPRAPLNLVPFRQKSRKIHDFVYPQKIFHNQSHATGVCQNCLYILRYKDKFQVQCLEFFLIHVFVIVRILDDTFGQYFNRYQKHSSKGKS